MGGETKAMPDDKIKAQRELQQEVKMKSTKCDINKYILNVRFKAPTELGGGRLRTIIILKNSQERRSGWGWEGMAYLQGKDEQSQVFCFQNGQCTLRLS